jgi:hypothetical protein
MRALGHGLLIGEGNSMINSPKWTAHVSYVGRG